MTERFLRAYYYSFDPTGNDAIDAILEAVAKAGKAYHSTENWGEEAYGGNGKSYVEMIQDAANAAASVK